MIRVQMHRDILISNYLNNRPCITKLQCKKNHLVYWFTPYPRVAMIRNPKNFTVLVFLFLMIQACDVEDVEEIWYIH
jgi:hypothetical protein